MLGIVKKSRNMDNDNDKSQTVTMADNKTVLQALALINDCNKYKMDLTTNGVIITLKISSPFPVSAWIGFAIFIFNNDMLPTKIQVHITSIFLFANNGYITPIN